MTALIKAATAVPMIRPFEARTGPVLAAVAPERPAAEIALDEARSEIARLNRALIDADAAAKAAEKTARETGLREGLAAAESDAGKRISALAECAEGAIEAWHERLAGLDRLAVSLAHAALRKVLGDGSEQAALVSRIIASKVAGLRRETIVAMRVSARDFADAAALAALREHAATGAIPIVAEESFASGACRIDLQLGHLDLGVATQRAELEAFLATLDEPEGAL